jgi:hypothetical protein
VSPSDPSVSRALRSVPSSPRKPGPRARKLIFRFNASQKVFGLVGGIFFIVGVPFVIAFAGQVPSDLGIAFAGRQAVGQVVSAELDYSSTVNGRHPTEVRFSYGVGDRTYQARSSALDDQLLSLEPNAAVNIEVASFHPAWARVAGTTRSWTGYFGLFTLIFPLLGATLLIVALRSRRRAVRAFTFGLPVVARVVQSGLDGSVQINGRHPFQVVWQFQIEGETYEGKVSSMDSFLIEPLAQASEVIVLHDRDDPRVNTIYID